MGKFEKNPKLKDHFEVVSESVIKTVFSFIPAGPIFDSFWNYRANLKQKRVIDFSESVKNVLEEIGGNEFHSSNFETEDFVDIMEAVYMKVMNTQSLYKLERFRNILVNQIIDKPLDYQLTLKYVELVSSLSDIEMLILGFIKELYDYKGFYTMKDICNKLAEYEREEDEIVINNNEIHVRIANSEMKITPFDIEFYVGELINKGLIYRRELMVEIRPKLISKWGKGFHFSTEPTTILSGETVCIVYPITGFGHSFIDFIKNHDNSISGSSVE